MSSNNGVLIMGYDFGKITWKTFLMDLFFVQSVKQRLELLIE